MTNIDMNVNRREISVRPQNRINKITKQADGSMSIDFASGSHGVLSADDADIQAFAIYSILAEL